VSGQGTSAFDINNNGQIVGLFSKETPNNDGVGDVLAVAA
jgi:hypothetical protein